MLRKVSYLLVAMTLFFLLSLDVKAINHVVDYTKEGSLEITLKERSENVGVENAEVTIYKIADAYDKGGIIGFKYAEQFKNCSASLDNLEDNDLTKEISKCVTAETTGISKFTDSNGYTKFTRLDLGLYLVTQNNMVEGYSKFDSFLTMTPNLIDNSWEYDIKAFPKTDIYRTIDLTVKKVWNSNGKKLPEYVEIQLLLDEEVIQAVMLSDDNDWTYTWENIEKSDKYNVREINIPKGYKVTYKKNEYVYTVTNTDTLPNTGQLYYSIILLALGGIAFVILGIIKNKKENA